MNEGIEYVDYLINKTEELTRKLNESTDSEGICADMGRNLSSGRGSMTSSINNDRMFLSTITPKRTLPSRIPALMTKSLHSPRSQSTPRQSAYGSGEQLCQDYGRGYETRRYETEILLSRSQERRQQRASSYDPRCLLALHSAPNRLSASACTSNNFLPMTSSSMQNSTSSFSRLLPKRPQWIRSQPTVQLAESTVSLEFLNRKDGFYLNSDEDSSDFDEKEPEEEEVLETPKRRLRRMMSLRKLKERNRRKYRSGPQSIHLSSLS
uniref:BZIP domain-containing protein n=1 Tax=Caenorhabditis tropicalis TaxID=1561998 RepID=A0A1I7TPJ8_9PELO